MKNKKAFHPSIQIISFDIPHPPNYGGIIDVFFKLKALHALGVDITLHCFRYRGKNKAPELEAYCTKVFYYDRPLSWFYQISLRPFITATRRPEQMLQRLKSNPAPILFEGLHSCGFIDHPDLQQHLKMVRMHNVEWQYYRNLAHLESHWIKRLYLHLESQKLQYFEKKVIQNAHFIFPISSADAHYFEAKTKTRVCLLPAFHGNTTVASRPGRGTYALFHGKLGVRDNTDAARFLIENVFSQLKTPLIVAGLEAPNELKTLCARHINVTLVDSPDDQEMKKLLREAHIQLLFSYQSDGIKIKLLNALYQGRFCVANSAMVHNSGLEALCLVADSAEEIGQAIIELLPLDFTREFIEARTGVLENLYSDQKNARKIKSLLEEYAVEM